MLDKAYKVADFAPVPSPGIAIQTKTVELNCAAGISIAPIAWLWPNWLAAGKLHILAGAPGVAKTLLALHMAVIITSDGKWPDGSRAWIGNVVIWSGEDDPADTLVPRLMAAGADLNRVFFVGATRQGPERPRPFDPAQDILALEQAIGRSGGAALIIVDPIVSAVPGDSHKNAETRRSLQPLCDLASKTGAALVGISHFTKGTGGRDPVERITGSLAFGAVARIVMIAAKEQSAGGEAPDRRIFARAKNNIGPDDGGFTYSVEQVALHAHEGVVASVVRWGEPIDGTAREILAVAAAEPEQDGGGALTEASAFLRQELQEGDVEAKIIKRRAAEVGIAERTLRRAGDEVGAKRLRVRFGKEGVWVWRMVETDRNSSKVAKSSIDGQHNNLATYGKSWPPMESGPTDGDDEVVL